MVEISRKCCDTLFDMTTINKYKKLQPLDYEAKSCEKYGITENEAHYYMVEFKESGILGNYVRHADVIIVRGDEAVCNRVFASLHNADFINEFKYIDDAQEAAYTFNSYVKDIGRYGQCHNKEIRTEFLRSGINLELAIDMDDDENVFESILTVFYGEGDDECELFTVDEASGESDIDEDVYNTLYQLPDDAWNDIVDVISTFVLSYKISEDFDFEKRCL